MRRGAERDRGRAAQGPGQGRQVQVFPGAEYRHHHRLLNWLFDAAAGGQGAAVFVCAHGAGGHMADRGMTLAAEALRGAGFDVVRFNFPYREAGSKRPDPMPVLKASVAAAAERARKELQPRKLVLGGRSMGGRAATMLAADGFDCDGLLLLAYPLHPAGKPEQLRDAHLAQIRVPVLCFNGTRDALCRRDLMEQVLQKLSWEMYWLEGADHSFHASGKTDHEVLREVADVSRSWLSRLNAQAPRLPARGE